MTPEPHLAQLHPMDAARSLTGEAVTFRERRDGLAIQAILAVACGVGSWFVLPKLWLIWSGACRQRWEPVMYLALLLPLGALLLGGCVALHALRRGRFGAAVFETPAPGEGLLGGPLEGVIRTGRPVRFEAPVRLTLACIVTTTTGGGKHQSTRSVCRWQSERTLPAGDTADPLERLPVAFALPGDEGLPPTGREGRVRVEWQLCAHSRMAGPDFRATFKVPVRDPGGRPLTAAQFARAAQIRAEVAAETAAYTLSPQSRIRIQTSPDGYPEFCFPPALSPWNASVTTVSALAMLIPVCLGPAKILDTTNNSLDTFDKVGLSIGVLLFGTITLLLGWNAFRDWALSTRLEITPDACLLGSKMMGLTRRVRIPVEEIAAAKSQLCATSGHRTAHHLLLTTRHGNKHWVIARNVSPQREADYLAQEINRVLDAARRAAV